VAITQPDRPAGRGKKLASTPVKVAALAADVPVLTPERLRDFRPQLQAYQPDVCIVASYGRIVPQALLDAVPLWLNLHPSALPLYRGATPIQSVIRDGRTTTAISVIAMDAGMDTGDILVQTAALPIAADETYGALHDRLAQLGGELVMDVLRDLEAGRLTRTPQTVWAERVGISSEEIAATLTRPIARSDGDLLQRAAELGAGDLVRLVRSLHPTPGAFLDDPLTGRLKILRAHVALAAPVTGERVPAGTLVANRGFLSLAGADGTWLDVDELVAPGGKSLTMQAYANGHPGSGPEHLVGRMIPR
jgi:methionyl-tRNA formyltransferase